MEGETKRGGKEAEDGEGGEKEGLQKQYERQMKRGQEREEGGKKKEAKGEFMHLGTS